MYRIGIDLGGTKIEGICLDENLKVIQRKRIPTNQQNGYSGIVKSIISLVSDVAKDTDEYNWSMHTRRNL